MAEIGAALREARTRARIEIAQMEAQTKIRAKYLRALENEEWDLLPGPTYVKSFLKTYGDMLGLDGRQLVADYKRGNEPFQAEGDIGQLSKHTGGRMNRQQQQSWSAWRTAGIVALVVVVIGVAVYGLTRGGGSGSGSGSGSPSSDLATTPDGGSSGGSAPAATAEVVVTATKSVTVCVRAGSRIIVRQDKLSAGEKTKAARGKSLLVSGTNRSVRLTVDGQRATLPAGDGPFTVKVTSDGVTAASAATTACRV